jgi:hypothetical protein
MLYSGMSLDKWFNTCTATKENYLKVTVSKNVLSNTRFKIWLLTWNTLNLFCTSLSLASLGRSNIKNDK